MILIAAEIFGIAIELLSPHDVLKHFKLSDSPIGTLIIILIGIPVYFCNGADVLFLQPMLLFGGLSFGGGMAFSLTSTSVCITSLILMIKYIGKRLTAVVILCVIVLTFTLSLIVESLPFLRYSVL